MMFAELYRYGITYKNLPVPGIGTFTWETIPAKTDFPNKLLYPPSYRVQFDNDTYVPGAYFFQWLGQNLSVSGRDAVFRFNDFAFDLKKQISEGAVVNWKGVGTLQKGLAGEMKFTPELPEILLQEPVPAEKIIRGNAEHMVRVGEEQRSSAEMTALLNKTGSKKRTYDIYIAWTLLVMAVLFVGWHFYQNGANPGATANTLPLETSEVPVTYRVVAE